ncbi:MAG TPA: GNAT family N-acetyltransferase [Kofleriaceae bacterium]|nr:GNAT family N-acetyltransferase [Kofleriaceae bacterium]
MTPATDLELLILQAEGALDPAGRLAGEHGITIACAPGAHALWIGSEVPDAAAAELAAAFAATAPAGDPAEPPRALDRCRRILEAGRAVEQHAGPSFVFPDAVPSSTAVRVERCDRPAREALRKANPGNWEPVEWDQLLDGRLGPWTMVLDGDRAVSICHTPGALRPRAAECGVWTQPGARGRGYAAATAAVWADILRPTGRVLFSSTDAANRSSQRVAERLRLRPIGWTWRLHAPDPDAQPVHPLSTLRRG